MINLIKAIDKDVNGLQRIDLKIELEDVADGENELEFNANQPEDKMRDCIRDGDSSSCTGSE